MWRETMEATALREFLADTAWGDLDLLLVDLAPGAPRLPTLVGLLPALDGALVVTVPSEVSQLVVGRSVELARAQGVRVLGLVENMAGYLCPACGTVGDLFERESRSLAGALGLEILGWIPFDPRIGRCADRGPPYAVEFPETTAGRAFQELCARLSALLSPEESTR